MGSRVPYFIAGVNYRVFMKVRVKAKMRLMASEGADFQWISSARVSRAHFPPLKVATAEKLDEKSSSCSRG